MAILEKYVSKTQYGNRTFTPLRTALTQFDTQENVKNKNSRTIERIIDLVESNSRWLDIKRYRNNIVKVTIKTEVGLYQNEVNGVWIQIHYNLTGNK